FDLNFDRLWHVLKIKSLDVEQNRSGSGNQQPSALINPALPRDRYCPEALCTCVADRNFPQNVSSNDVGVWNHCQYQDRNNPTMRAGTTNDLCSERVHALRGRVDHHGMRTFLRLISFWFGVRKCKPCLMPNAIRSRPQGASGKCLGDRWQTSSARDLPRRGERLPGGRLQQGEVVLLDVARDAGSRTVSRTVPRPDSALNLYSHFAN